MTPAPADRRQRRRQETIEEVLDVAVELMAEHGVGGLSIGEVARRMGIRPPSLYVYFASKNDIYDALFERGARQVLEALRAETDELLERSDLGLEDFLLAGGGAMLRWTMENQPYSQLLFWRVVPGFVPSEAAYAPAVELMEKGHRDFLELQRRGLLRADVPVDDILRDWTILTAGIGSQQLSNAPTEPFATGRFTAALPGVVDMFARHYAPEPTAKPSRRTRRADQR